MSVTRKEFFRQGFLSLGKTVLEIAGTLKGGGEAVSAPRTEAEPRHEPRPDMKAEAFNERCLARSCGCFTCAEKCESQAVMVVPGVGIRIDESLCTGCGTCEYVCPVQPKAVVLVPRSNKS